MGKQESELRVALVGSYPPPYGGVSIHVQRLHARCLSNNIRCTVFDTSSYVKSAKHVVNLSRVRNWLHIFTSRQDIIHAHTTSMHWKIPVFFFCLSKLKGVKFVLTYHSLRYNAEDFSPLGRKMMRMVLASASHCITTNSELKTKLLFLGAKSEKISVIPAFLPPVKNEQEIAGIPQQVWNFIDGHTPMISANAFTIVLHDGQDRYGLDMCIDLCANLKVTYSQVGFVFCLPHIGDYDYFDQMKRRVVEKGIEDNFLFQTRPYQFYPILAKSDVFVRPTNTDGDAVSLREALYFKIPSVASDAISRPEGSILFRNRDVNDFTLKVREVLDNYEWHKKKLEAIKPENNFEKIMRIYQILETEMAARREC